MSKGTKKNQSKKSSKKSYTKVTHVAIVLDRSGSMNSFHKSAVDGINAQFAALRKTADLGGLTKVSLFQFDDVVDVVFDGVDAPELREWAYEEFMPRGSTALNDAIWKAITHLKSQKREEDTAYMVCVISDGQENASKEITEDALTSTITTLTNTGEWTFTYILGGLTQAQESSFASTYNVHESNVMSFNLNNASYSTAATVTANSIGTYMNSRGNGAKYMPDGLYSDKDKLDVRSK